MKAVFPERLGQNKRNQRQSNPIDCSNFIEIDANLLNTRCNTPKRVKSWRAHLRVIAPTGNTVFFKGMLLRWQAVGNTMSNSTGSRIKPKTSHSRYERVTT